MPFSPAREDCHRSYVAWKTNTRGRSDPEEIFHAGYRAGRRFEAMKNAEVKKNENES